MTPETYAALLGAVRSRRDKALLELMWEGGLRPGEVLGLRLEDVSYAQRRVSVRKRDDHPAGCSRNPAGTGPSTCTRVGPCRH